MDQDEVPQTAASLIPQGGIDVEKLMIEKELEILTDICHPNILEMYEIYEDDHYYYSMMNCCC